MTSCEPQPAAPPRKRPWFQFSLRTLFVFMLLVALGLSGFAVIKERAEREARLRETHRAFTLVWICLSGYDDRFGHLPHAVRRESVGRKTETGMPNGSGRPLYSWRGEISAWTRCGYPGFISDLSEPWDSPANQDEGAGPGPYCYSSRDEEWGKVSCQTNMLAICGPGTAFGCEGEQPRSLKDLGGNTILAIEVRHSGIHWMQPGDFDIRDMPHTINAADGRGVSSPYPGGFHVLFSDGEVWFLSEKIPFETLARFFTVDEAKNGNREELLAAFVLRRSAR